MNDPWKDLAEGWEKAAKSYKAQLDGAIQFIEKLADSQPEKDNLEHWNWQALACETLKDLRNK